MFWHSYILHRSFYFILNCIRLPEKRRPRRLLWLTGTSALRLFRLPEERRPRRSTCNPGFSLPLAFQ